MGLSIADVDDQTSEIRKNDTYDDAWKNIFWNEEAAEENELIYACLCVFIGSPASACLQLIETEKLVQKLCTIFNFMRVISRDEVLIFLLPVKPACCDDLHLNERSGFSEVVEPSENFRTECQYCSIFSFSSTDMICRWTVS